MKKLFTLVFISVIGVLTTSAQMNKDEVQLSQAIWGKEKRDIVIAYMKFSDAEAKAFWPIYDAYQTESKVLGEERINTIADYSSNLSTLNNAKADEIATKMLKNNLSVDQLQSKYYVKMK